jgi:hypothetical protein
LKEQKKHFAAYDEVIISNKHIRQHKKSLSACGDVGNAIL